MTHRATHRSLFLLSVSLLPFPEYDFGALDNLQTLATLRCCSGPAARSPFRSIERRAMQ
jgi:hypothetical protein